MVLNEGRSFLSHDLADILGDTDFDFKIFSPNSACTEGVLADEIRYP